ncbi:hypothetical protein B0H13DRAFT_1872876 [Mycena leptocephala]|nr:hypothetical protein B0H13DRAFT_1872876 [Mycena leptocephala]
MLARQRPPVQFMLRGSSQLRRRRGAEEAESRKEKTGVPANSDGMAQMRATRDEHPKRERKHEQKRWSRRSTRERLARGASSAGCGIEIMIMIDMVGESGRRKEWSAYGATGPSAECGGQECGMREQSYSRMAWVEAGGGSLVGVGVRRRAVAGLGREEGDENAEQHEWDSDLGEAGCWECWNIKTKVSENCRCNCHGVEARRGETWSKATWNDVCPQWIRVFESAPAFYRNESEVGDERKKQERAGSSGPIA